MFPVLRAILFQLEPEDAHHFTTGFLQLINKLPGGNLLLGKLFVSPKSKPVQIANILFPNAIGLAAGFDKNAKYLKIWKSLGFGHVEIGTVTPLPQPGNEKPRLFRLPIDFGIINRMGFNNDGVDQVVKNLMNRPEGLIIGGNIGKNKITPNDEAVNDYLICFDKLYDYVDYFTVNISSPNTPGLRELQSIENIIKITDAIFELQKEKAGKEVKPVLIKLSPDMAEDDLIAIVKWINGSEIAGLVLTNTTISRDNLKTSKHAIDKIGAGGLSGTPVKILSDKALQTVSKILSKDKIIIGVGGIMSCQDALDKKNAGAHLVQIYTGFVYKGPKLVKEIASNWED